MQQKTPLTYVKGDKLPRYHLGSPQKAASFTLSRAYPSLPKKTPQQGGSGAMFVGLPRVRFHLTGLSCGALCRLLFPSLPFAVFTRTDYLKSADLSIKGRCFFRRKEIFCCKRRFSFPCAVVYWEKRKRKRRTNDETGFLERQRPAGRAGQGLP